MTLLALLRADMTIKPKVVKAAASKAAYDKFYDECLAALALAQSGFLHVLMLCTRPVIAERPYAKIMMESLCDSKTMEKARKEDAPFPENLTGDQKSDGSWSAD